MWSYAQERSSSRHCATLSETCRSPVAISASRRSKASAATIREVPCLLSSRVRRPFVVSKRSRSLSWWYCYHHVHVEPPRNSCVLARTPYRSNQFAPFSRNSLASFIFVARYGLPPRSGWLRSINDRCRFLINSLFTPRSEVPRINAASLRFICFSNPPL